MMLGGGGVCEVEGVVSGFIEIVFGQRLRL